MSKEVIEQKRQIYSEILHSGASEKEVLQALIPYLEASLEERLKAIGAPGIYAGETRAKLNEAKHKLNEIIEKENGTWLSFAQKDMKSRLENKALDISEMDRDALEIEVQEIEWRLTFLDGVEEVYDALKVGHLDENVLISKSLEIRDRGISTQQLQVELEREARASKGRERARLNKRLLFIREFSAKSFSAHNSLVNFFKSRSGQFFAIPKGTGESGSSFHDENEHMREALDALEIIHPKHQREILNLLRERCLNRKGREKSPALMY